VLLPGRVCLQHLRPADLRDRRRAGTRSASSACTTSRRCPRCRCSRSSSPSAPRRGRRDRPRPRLRAGQDPDLSATARASTRPGSSRPTSTRRSGPRGGRPVEDVDRALKDFGFPVGPIALIDEVGIDVGPMCRAISAPRSPAAATFRVTRCRGSARRLRRAQEPARLLRLPGGEAQGPQAGQPGGVCILRRVGAPRPRPHGGVDRLALMMVNERCAVSRRRDLVTEGRRPRRGARPRLPPLRAALPPHRHRRPAIVVDRMEKLATRYGPRFAPARAARRDGGAGRPLLPARPA